MNETLELGLLVLEMGPEEAVDSGKVARALGLWGNVHLAAPTPDQALSTCHRPPSSLADTWVLARMWQDGDSSWAARKIPHSGAGDSFPGRHHGTGSFP